MKQREGSKKVMLKMVISAGVVLSLLSLIVFVYPGFKGGANLEVTSSEAPYPPSPVITDISFDTSTLRIEAPGSDNWPITWADDDHQYTSWGDGGGFGGTNNDGRVSLGFARIEGTKDNYTGYNVWGGKNPENPEQFNGKSYGIISIDGILYMWRCGGGSNNTAYEFQQLYKSTNHSATWEFTGVEFDQGTFPGSPGFFCPTFLQFGKDYQGARDNYVYSYAPEIKDDNLWGIQKPGEITLMRVLKTQITNQSQYEYFAGLNGNGNPTWTNNLADRKPVFEDAVNGVMRTSASYNAGLGRYLLITQQVAVQTDENSHIGIYDAPEPWGPWTTVIFAPSTIVQSTPKTVFWNFSNKWLSPDGKDFVLVYTYEDEWATLEGSFTIAVNGSNNSVFLPMVLQD